MSETIKRYKVKVRQIVIKPVIVFAHNEDEAVLNFTNGEYQEENTEAEDLIEGAESTEIYSVEEAPMDKTEELFQLCKDDPDYIEEVFNQLPTTVIDNLYHKYIGEGE